MNVNEMDPKGGQSARSPFGRVVNVTKTFQAAGKTVPAVKDVSFQFRKGDLISLLGPSGCGKTTVLKMMGGLVPSSGGLIELEGRRNQRTVSRRRCGVPGPDLDAMAHGAWKCAVSHGSARQE